jgi:quercetin dioxygenase-like cupin family protein
MKKLPVLLAGAMLLVGSAAAAQTAQPPLRSTPVLTQALQDSAFAGMVVNSSVLELRPGGVVAEPHRHDAELFGYILEGAVLTSLENGPIQRYEQGEMFYERRGILHSHFANASEDVPARVLIFNISRPAAPAQ